MMERIIRSELQTYYPKLEPMLKRYCNKFPEYDSLCMLKGILDGSSVLWMGEESFAIGSPLDYDNKTVFFMECTAGSLEEIMEAMPIIESDIKAWGFNEIEVCGRQGWVKKMKPHGFNLDRVILRKTIGE